MSTIFMRQRNPELRTDDGVLVPDSWFQKFGSDTASVFRRLGLLVILGRIIAEQMAALPSWWASETEQAEQGVA